MGEKGCGDFLGVKNGFPPCVHLIARESNSCSFCVMISSTHPFPGPSFLAGRGAACPQFALVAVCPEYWSA